MNLSTNATTTTANPLPPSPPLALITSTSSPSSSGGVRIVIPSNHIQTQTLLQQSPSLVTPPTAPPSAALPAVAVVAVSASPFVSTSKVSNPLEPRDQIDVVSAPLSSVVSEIPSTITNVPVDSKTTKAMMATPMNEDDEDDDEDGFMMDIEIPNILGDDDDDVNDDLEEGGIASSSVPQLDHTNTTASLTTSKPVVIVTTTQSTATTTTTTNNNAKSKNSAVSGVVNAGVSAIDKEKIGRWTEQEHLLFLEGLRNHGKQWKVIATMIGTRTVVQVRTHAQKYFQKLDRNSGGAGTSSSSSQTKLTSSTSVASTTTTTTTNKPVTTSSSSSATAIPETQQQQLLSGATTTSTTLLSPKSTIIPPQPQQQRQRQTYTKRKSLPSSLPSRHNPKKPRTSKMNPRLSMGSRGTSSSTTTTTASVPPSTLMGTNNMELPSYSSSMSKSSSSTGSDENWSTISPDNVIWDRVDFGNSSSNYSEYAIISEDNSNSALYGSSNTADDDAPTSNNHSAFDLLGEDPLEWLIETDCTQQYLPESSLPLFPFHTISSDDDKLNIHNDIDGDDDDNDDGNMAAMDSSSNDLLLRMADPNVTVQSLFLPHTTTTDDDMAILEQ